MHGGNVATLHAATYNRVARPSPVKTTAVATIPNGAAMSAAERPVGLGRSVTSIISHGSNFL